MRMYRSPTEEDPELRCASDGISRPLGMATHRTVLSRAGVCVIAEKPTAKLDVPNRDVGADALAVVFVHWPLVRLAWSLAGAVRRGIEGQPRVHPRNGDPLVPSIVNAAHLRQANGIHIINAQFFSGSRSCLRQKSTNRELGLRATCRGCVWNRLDIVEFRGWLCRRVLAERYVGGSDKMLA